MLKARCLSLLIITTAPTSVRNLQGDIEQAPVIMQQMQQINDWYAPLEMQVEDIILTPRMTWLVL